MLAHGKTLAAAATVAFAGSAFASNELQIDINALLSQVVSAEPVAQDMHNSSTSASTPASSGVRGGGFGLNFTGTVNISDKAGSSLAGILIDGIGQTVTGTLADFVGTINLENGDVTGGSFRVDVLESDAVTMNTYTATIVANIGQVEEQAGQGFTINGLTFEGMFSSDTFAGVDVSLWNDNEPLVGSFIEISLDPDDNGLDNDTDVDLFVTPAPVVPLPSAPALAGVGLVGVLAGARRRRLG